MRDSEDRLIAHRRDCLAAQQLIQAAKLRIASAKYAISASRLKIAEVTVLRQKLASQVAAAQVSSS